jgi:hypothetical protein
MISKERFAEAWGQALSFRSYLDAWNEAIELSKDTDMGLYVSLNQKRTERWQKTKPWRQEMHLNGSLLNEKWLILTEYWCGDAAHNIPPLQDYAESLGIEVRYLFRDEWLDIMDTFLTNGGRSIPKLIRLTTDFSAVLGTWGPRPEAAQEEYAELRKKHSDYQQILEPMQKWYNANKGREVVREVRRFSLPTS